MGTALSRLGRARGGSAGTASGRAGGSGAAAASALGLQSPPQPHGGVLDCRAAAFRRRPGPRVGGREVAGRSGSESAWPGSSMNTGKGEVPAAGRGLAPGTSEEGILFLLIELFLCFGFSLGTSGLGLQSW